MTKIATYLNEVGTEMRKVSWPSQNEAMQNTMITLFATLVISLFIYGADQVISKILTFIYV